MPKPLRLPDIKKQKICEIARSEVCCRPNLNVVSLMDRDKAELETYIESSGHEPEAETEFSVLGTTGVDDEDKPDEDESEGTNSDTDHNDHNDHPISKQAAVEEFASRLREAQCLAIEIKKAEQKGKKKTPRTYLGNSKKTQHRREKAQKALASKGFLSIATFMALKG